MNLIKAIKSQYRLWAKQKAIHILTHTDPDKIVAYGKKKVIPAFQRAVQKISAYKNFLAQNNIDPRKIKDIESFKGYVPILDKELVFQDNNLEDLCVDTTFKDIVTFYSSSGYSGKFSFGVETQKSIRQTQKMIDFFLDYQFRVKDKKTLLINCLPMGVKVYSDLVKTADTGVRYDVALALIKKLAKSFDQIIIVGEHLLLKQLIEAGIEQGINWENLIVHLITGGEFIAENWRSYMANLLAIDFEHPENGSIAINMGLSELSLSIFRENPNTVRMRRHLLNNHNLRSLLLGNNQEICPMIMQYIPVHVFLETQGQPNGRKELVVTLLGDVQIPLIRYRTGDEVHLISYKKMDELLTRCGCNHLMPSLKLPFGLIYGRFKGLVIDDNIQIFPEFVKEALYGDFHFAGCITGNFRILKSNPLQIIIQLKKGIGMDNSNLKGIEKVREIIAGHIKIKPDINLIPYPDFPFSMELNFEQKIQYL